MLMSDTFSAAHDNQSKNRGTPGEWFAHRADYRETARQPRIRPEARGIVERNRPNISMAAMAGYADRPQKNSTDEDGFYVDSGEPNGDSSKPRLRTVEAQSIADKSRQQTDKWHDFQGNLTYQPRARPPRIGAGDDAQEILTQMTKKPDWFDDSSRTANPEARHARRPESAGGTAFQRRNGDNTWFTHVPANTGGTPINTSSQRPHGRNRPDAMEYALKNRGTTDILHMGQTTVSNRTVPYGCPSEESRYNAVYSTKGTDMAQCMGQSGPEEMPSSEVRPRTAKVRGADVEEWRNRGQHGSLGPSVNGGTNEQDSEPQHVIRRVRPEAEEIRERSTTGSRLINCLHVTDSSRVGLSDEPDQQAPHQRIRSSEAQAAMHRNRGMMSQFLGPSAQSVTQPCPRKLHPRSLRSSEGQETQLKSNGQGAKELLSNDRLSPKRIHSGFSRMSEEGRQMAERNQKGLAGNLMGAGRSSAVPLVGLEAPAPQRLHYEATEYAAKSRGDEMGALLRLS